VGDLHLLFFASFLAHAAPGQPVVLDRVPVGFAPSLNRLVGPIADPKIGVAYGSPNLLIQRPCHERTRVMSVPGLSIPETRGPSRRLADLGGRSFRHPSSKRPKCSARCKKPRSRNGGQSWKEPGIRAEW